MYMKALVHVFVFLKGLKNENAGIGWEDGFLNHQTSSFSLCEYFPLNEEETSSQSLVEA